MSKATTLTTEQIKQLLDFTEQRFPNWQGFHDPRFEEAEITFKQNAIQKAKSLISEYELLELNAQKNYDEFINRLIKVAHGGGNLLYFSTPSKGDINVLYQDKLNKAEFCQAFVDLIYGSDPSPIRLDRYASFIQQSQLPNKWTFPTYFLFVCHPEAEIFVKPRTFQWFFRFLGLSEALTPSPSQESYANLLYLCKQLWNALQIYQPRDYVDIQGFIWSAYLVSANPIIQTEVREKLLAEGIPDELTPEDSEEETQMSPMTLGKAPEQLFDERTFQLLEQLHDNPTQNFYSEHKQEFKEKIEQPFKDLTQQTAERLRPEIVELMETEKGVFARFYKNDFGKMGTWDFYWGAFYPKGGKRQNDPQLSLWINFERLEIGFYIGDYGTDARARFRKNCQENTDKLLEWLNDVVLDASLVIGSDQAIMVEPDDSVTTTPKISWHDFLCDPEKGNYDVSMILPKDKLLQMSSEQLVELVSRTYNRLFPLVILATSDSPLPLISAYLGIAEKSDIQPIYPIEQFVEETGIDLDELSKWLRAIERKKQVILYGPPGTGKTYLAEKLAQHLVGGGDGFYQLVQFHPEVSYEDFIQGIRPKSLEGGGLHYPVVQGRFVEFCEKAQSREKTCILIIDEINRANLARVFGELMYLLEYRDNEIELSAGNRFKIPANVRIIGTMNTADRSIALVDHALRRRFAMLALYPNYDFLRKYHQRENTGFAVEGLITILEDLNKQIADRHYAIGTSYFLRKDIATQIAGIWQMEIEPYLEEFFFDQPEKYQRFCWDIIAKKIMG